MKDNSAQMKKCFIKGLWFGVGAFSTVACVFLFAYALVSMIQ